MNNEKLTRETKSTPETRRSRQRQLVYRIVAGSGQHPTADWIYGRARLELPALSLGTVYRNLQVLEREGRIRAIDSWGTPTRYDADLSPHYHFVCGGCGGITDIEKPPGSDEEVAALMREAGYLITGHVLEFRGLCPACGKADGAKTTPRA